MSTVWQDLRYALRQLRRSPGFSAIIVLMLALGIGANSALFGIVNAVLLRPLPYPHPDRIVSLGTPGGGMEMADNQTIDMLFRAPPRSFETMAAYKPGGANLMGSDQPERVNGASVTAAFFRVMKMHPTLGREFTPSELRSSGAPVVILGAALWARDFGSDPRILGHTVKLDDKSYTVVGVMPTGFAFPRRAEYWLPLQLVTTPDPASIHYSFVVGRLRPHVTLGTVRTELTSFVRLHGDELPHLNIAGPGHATIGVTSLHARLYGNLRPALLILLGAMGCVLLIACANIANLLLARATVRRRELAVRTALGASRGRLVRQVLVESLVLALLGGGLGLVVAMNTLGLFMALAPRSISRVPGIALDTHVLLFTLGISLLTGLLFGLAPALARSRGDLRDALNEGSLRLAGATRGTPRRLLVTAELAMAMVLLIGAGLLAKSFVRFRDVPFGFSADGVLTASITLPAARYDNQPAIAEFYRRVIERVRAIPGVASATLDRISPLGGAVLTRNTTRDKSGAIIRQTPLTAHGSVGSEYFRTFGIPLRAGREFTDADDASSPRVGIINESLARFFFPKGSALGHQLSIGAGHPYTVVGVAADVRIGVMDKTAPPTAYLPMAQSRLPRSAEIALRARPGVDPLSLATALRQAVRAVDPQQPVSGVTTLVQEKSEFLAPQRFNALLIGAIAALALLLAAFGLYGLLAYMVAQRTHEIGIRMALGAEQGDVLSLVLRQGLTLVAVGVVVGLGAAFGVTRLLASLLFRVPATDATVFVVVPLVLIAVSVMATLLPARRAARVDPMIALRAE